MFQLGKTKLFIKNPTTVFQLEGERDEKVSAEPGPQPAPAAILSFLTHALSHSWRIAQIEQVVIRLQTAYRLYRIRREIGAWYTDLQSRVRVIHCTYPLPPTFR